MYVKIVEINKRNLMKRLFIILVLLYITNLSASDLSYECSTAASITFKTAERSVASGATDLYENIMRIQYMIDKTKELCPAELDERLDSLDETLISFKKSYEFKRFGWENN